MERENWNRFVQHGSATGTNTHHAYVAQITTMPPENTAARGRDGMREKQEVSFINQGKLTTLSVTHQVCSDDKNIL